MVNNIGDKSLDRSLWLLKNISKIRLLIQIFFISLILFEFYIIVINFKDIIVSGNQFSVFYKNILSNKNFGVFDTYLKRIAPESISVKQIGIVKGYGENFYDFYAYLENVSDIYKLDSFEYYFEYNNGLKTISQTSNLSLKDSRYVFIRGVESDVELKDAKIVINNTLFKLVDRNKGLRQRYSNTKIPEDCDFKENDLNWSDIKITSNKSNRDNLSINTIEFSVTNNSLFDYNIVNNKILFLSDSNEVLGIYEKEIYQLRSKEKKYLNFNLSKTLPSFKNILIVPEVNLCDENSFMDKENESRGI